jgi:hypothetical protein
MVAASDCGSVDLVVFNMAANKADVDCLKLVFNFDDKPILVATDVEYHPVVGKKTGALELGLDLLGVIPAGRLDQSVPGLEGLFSIAMARLPVLHQGSLGNDAHTVLRLLPLWEEEAPLSRGLGVCMVQSRWQH